MKKNYVGLIFGTRKVIKNECSDEDFLKNGLKLPSPNTRNEYKLTKCLNCGHILPASIKTIRRGLPKKCSFCSGIGYKGTLTLNRNVYIETDNCYEIVVAYKDITVTTYIDKNDYDKVKQYSWRISKKKNKYYVVTGQAKNKTLLYLHNLLMNNYIPKDNYEVDHIDGNSLNNRKKNLHIVSRLENIQNTSVRIDNQIGIRGVSKSRNKYRVDFYYNNKRYYFKDWKTIEEAVYCRLIAEQLCNLHIAEKNPLVQQYLTLSLDQQNEIYNYVSQKILGN